MKRDMELVRNILLRFEESDKIRNGTASLKGLADEAVLTAHLQMLEDAGFLEKLDYKPHPEGVTFRMGHRITWAGHEFIDTIRDPEIWRKTKTGAEKLGSWSLKILGEMATGYVRAKAQELGLPVL